MQIPIDRPLIDARNIRPAATQTIESDDCGNPAIVHNNRRVILITTNNVAAWQINTQGSTVQAIQSGSVIGQRLRIMHIEGQNSSGLEIVNGTVTAKTVLRGNWSSPYGITLTDFPPYLEVVWNGTYWIEAERYDGYGWSAGVGCHAEGVDNTATGDGVHVEGRDNYVSGNYGHGGGRGGQTLGIGSRSFGHDALAYTTWENSLVQACSKFAARGDAEYVRIVGRQSITMSNAWQEILFLDGVDALFVIPASTLFVFEGIVAGLDDVSVGAANKTGFKITGAIWRDNANNTTILAESGTQIYAEDVSYDCRCVADDTNEALQVEVTDADNDGAVVRWVVSLWGSLVSFP